ncbi:chromosomal replication initiator protein DnaA [Hugenholtzia roseola]|uniref:chromosomal replication initiator protein DnaA n=1 Tax=Hugenholtzia roseola TaxID=1002 RepID=UPI000417DF16|nr:chromosomal replication initiator protein DnaA [Hugenholtzia roseola]
MTTQPHQQVWDICLQVIRSQVPEQSFKTWFLPIRPVRLTKTADGWQVLTIQVPTRYFYDWLEEHYVPLLERGIVAALGERGRLQYVLAPQQPQNSATTQNQNPKAGANLQNNPTSDEKNTDKNSEKNKSTSNSTPQTPLTGGKANSDLGNLSKKELFSPSTPIPNKGKKTVDSNLNGRYTFHNFVEGECNRLAVTTGLNIVENPGKTAFNPFVVWGGVGLGKTHLAQAIGNAIKERNPHANVLYISADQFGNDFVTAVREHKVQQFMNFYMALDVLILDDIQFFCNKNGMQENFFNVFNHLHQSQKQIIMTSDCAPKDLRGLQDRLLSRFKWGLTTDLRLPSYETRKAIIKAKMQEEGMFLQDEVVNFLAQHITTNVREIEGVLISLFAKASFLQQEITIDLVRESMSGVVKEEKKPLTLDDIQRIVAEIFGITVEELKAQTRKKNIAMARQFAMYFANKHTELPLKTIGLYFGKRDHSTVIHACKVIPDKVGKEAEYRELMKKIQEKLNAFK